MFGESNLRAVSDGIRVLKTLMTDLQAKGPAATDGNVHGFFGPLTGDEWGICQYKHVDHHLRQFGV